MKTMLTAAILAVLFFPNLGQPDKKCSPVQEVSLLELQKNSDIYDNSRVRIHGEYLTDYGHHSVVIRDPKTGKILVDIWLDFEDDSNIIKEYRNLSLADFVKLVTSGELKNMLNDIAWIVPLPVKPLPANQLKVIRRYWKRNDTKPANITIVGRFDYAMKGRLMMHRNGQTSFTSGFGNGSKWPYRIVAEKIVLQKQTL